MIKKQPWNIWKQKTTLSWWLTEQTEKITQNETETNKIRVKNWKTTKWTETTEIPVKTV